MKSKLKLLEDVYMTLMKGFSTTQKWKIHLKGTDRHKSTPIINLQNLQQARIHHLHYSHDRTSPFWNSHFPPAVAQVAQVIQMARWLWLSVTCTSKIWKLMPRTRNSNRPTECVIKTPHSNWYSQLFTSPLNQNPCNKFQQTAILFVCREYKPSIK